MSLKERSGFRSLVYSGWHRPHVLKQFIGTVGAAKLTMVDIDSCEACPYCKMPVALIETAHTLNDPKKAPITALLAWLAKIPAYSVSYSGDIERTSCDTCGRDNESGEPQLFLIRRIQPADLWVHRMTPGEYAAFLLSLRADHVCAPRVPEG
jgi:hypothetical protein